MPAGQATAAAVAVAAVSAAAAAGVIRVLRRRPARPVMPMVTGLPQSAAEAMIKAAAPGARLDIRRVPAGGLPAGTVVAQVPAAGGVLSRSGQVRLTVPAAPLPDRWIGLDARARRVNWRWTGFLTLVFAGMAAAAWLPEDGSSGFAAADRWGWAGVVGVGWLAGLLYMLSRGYGKTRLTPGGMQFESFVSRRHVRWDQVTRIEMHRHATRGGSWWDLRVHRARGRPLAVPGAFTFTSGDGALDTLKQKLALIREYQSSAARPQGQAAADEAGADAPN